MVRDENKSSGLYKQKYTRDNYSSDNQNNNSTSLPNTKPFQKHNKAPSFGIPELNPVRATSVLSQGSSKKNSHMRY